MKKIYLFLLLLLASVTGYASHIVGGDLRVVFRSQSAAGPVYRIVFNLYYDDKSGGVPLGNTDIVEIRDKRTGGLIRQVTVFKRSRITAVYPNSSCPNNILVNTGIYLYDVELVLDPAIYNDVQGYYVNSVSTCCRNSVGPDAILRNISANDFAFYTEFPRITNDAVAPFTNGFINSTPDFGPLSGEYLCVGQTFTASYAAIDPDGDSLEYDLVDPLGTAPIGAAPAVAVPYQAGYSLNNLFNASPAGQFKIDRLTGIVTVTPLPFPGATALGNVYAFAVRCTERRNGVKIGEVRREFQYLVRSVCDPAFLPIPSVPGLNTTSSGAYILDLNNGPTIDFIVKGSKGKAITKLEIVPQSANFTQQDLDVTKIFDPNPNSPGGVPLNIVTGEGKVKLTWPPCLYSKNANDIYEFDFIITDNSCPTANVSTTKVRLKVLQRNNPAPKWEIVDTRNIALIDKNSPINITSSPITVGDSVRFTIRGIDAGDSLRIRARASSDGEYFTFVPKNIVYTFPSTTKDLASADFIWTPQCSLVRNNERREELVLDIFIDERASCEKLRTTIKVKLILEDNGVTDDYQPVNVFTPNGDGKNDEYTLPMLRNAKCLYTFKKITIHNRYGKEVFQSSDEAFAWKAKDHPTGLYYYRIEYQNYEYKGSLQVLR